MSGTKHILFIAGFLLFAILLGMLVGLGAGVPLIALVVLVCGLIATMVDFRVGVILVVIMMPLAATVLMPRQLLGIPGFTPLNIVLAGTLGAALLAGIVGRRWLAPIPWRLFLPIIALLSLGAVIGMGKVPNIAPIII
ncbi:hypothetical protein ACFQT4_12230 [Pseudoduganella danionis]|uniref:hypothetical protein n=1 Tax=Pseudoduganella danionis TaxID=1890295 RepID=UPI0036075B63